MSDRLYLIEGDDPTGWEMVSAVPTDPTLRRKALVEMVASGCPLLHAAAAFRVSQATVYRDYQALEQAQPGFGSDEWALKHHERQAARLRRKLSRDDSGDEAMGN